MCGLGQKTIIALAACQMSRTLRHSRAESPLAELFTHFRRHPIFLRCETVDKTFWSSKGLIAISGLQNSIKLGALCSL
jgi:hypothetical protein